MSQFFSSSSKSDNMLQDRKSPRNSDRPAEEDKENFELNKEIKDLNLVPSIKTKFVINTIAYVPDREFSDDSSSDEMDETFSDADFNFDPKIKNSFPFTTTPKKGKKKKEIDFDEISISTQSDSISTIITPFLQKLSQNGFEEDERDKSTTSISASIALNRMKSLSTRKNKLLNFELSCKEVETDIRYEKFGFLWVREWYNKAGEPVEESLVRKFYKQLKKINPENAQKFISELEEKNIQVPYQSLRDYAKNHYKTKKLVQEFRNKDRSANIYLSLIDIDTVDFNGIYSAYLRIVKSYNVPTVMSTGYVYPEDEPEYRRVSLIDRDIRLITARHIPMGVYYPEPNMCVLIQQGCDTLQESFRCKTRKKGNLESACLIKEINNRENATFIFNDDKPLITTIPDRAKLTKKSKSPIIFSPEFGQGAIPSKDDIKACKEVAQSNLHEYTWMKNFFINDAIKFRTYDLKDYVRDPKSLQCCYKLLKTVVGEPAKSEARNSAIDGLKQHIPSDVVDVMVKKYVLCHCQHLVSKIRRFDETPTERSETINELKKYVIPNVVDAADKATEELIQYTKTEIGFGRSEDYDQLLFILKEYNIKIDTFSKDESLMLAQQPVLNLIEKEIINPQDLTELDTEVLECFCYDEEILEELENETVDCIDVLNLLNSNLSEYIEAKQEYSISYILDLYKENPLHLKFMADDDVNFFVLQNSDNEEIVKLGIENYDIDVDWIRCELNDSRDGDSATLMLFDSILDNIEEKSSHSDEESGHSDEKFGHTDEEFGYFDD